MLAPSGSARAIDPRHRASRLAALARRQRAAHHHPGGAAGDPADPLRTRHVGNAGRHPHRPAAGAVRLHRGARLAADRALRRADDPDRRTARDRGRLRAARRRARDLDALCRHDRDRLRRRHHASRAAAAGARLAPRSHRLRHRGVHQRAAGRRNPARGADDSRGAAVARQQLARKLPAVGRAGRRDRAHSPAARARARPRRRRRRRSAGGRTGTTR